MVEASPRGGGGRRGKLPWVGKLVTVVGLEERRGQRKSVGAVTALEAVMLKIGRAHV